MDKTIHFAHANSFPAPMYRQLHAVWQQAGYEVGYLPCSGHDPRYPVSDGWPQLVDEMLAFMQARYHGPVHAVGHSLGGILLFLAAIRAPARFRSVVLLDSPLLSPQRAFGIWLAKRLGFIQNVTPGGTGTLKRRDNWASVASVYDYFARKAAFARWAPEVLHDYAELGTEDNGQGGRRLLFRPQVEHDIYGTLPHHYWQLRGQLQVPMHYVAGAGSDVTGPSDLAFMQKHFGARIHWHPGSHLFPMEQPQASAAFVLTLLQPG